MLTYIAKRLILVIPVVFAVALVCFLLVHIAPGDPLVSVLPPDASADLAEQMKRAYGFDRPLPVQFGIWLMNALQGNLGNSIATGRSVLEEVSRAVGNTVMLSMVAAFLGFFFGLLFGFLAGYFRDSWIDRLVTILSITGVSMPHYWLGMVLVIVFSVQLGWLPAVGIGPGGWQWDWVHIQYLILPSVTMAVIPLGIVARTVRALVGDLLSQEFVMALRAKGIYERPGFGQVAKNPAPTPVASKCLHFR